MKNLATLITTIFLFSCNNNTTNERIDNNQRMEKDTEQFLKEMRVEKLKNTDTLVFEINLSDKRIIKTTPLIPNNNDLKMLQESLPPSYLKFLKTYSNGLHIEIGNGLTIFPIGHLTGYWTDVLSLTTETLSDSLFPSKDFVFFGMSGVDSEMFGFYTAKKYANGEYPIVWFTPGSVDTKPFVLLNSSFDKFLTMQYYLLKATDYEESYATYEEAAQASSDKNYMEEYNRNWQNFQNKLYDTFDPTIPKPNQDLYKSAVSLIELNDAIEKIKNNSR